jgi:4-hydroxy-2-oxoheptanedioate aldolase
MKENATKARLKAGKPVFGVISPSIDPVICEYLGFAGLDFYLIDGEHGAISPSDVPALVRACEWAGCTPLARVRAIDEKLISQFLDAGVMGVMMPNVQTCADAEALVKAVKYPPLGARGLGPVRAADYMMGPMKQADYVAFANQQILILAQIEDLTVVENLPELLSVDGIDGFVVGPRDLAMSMGFYDGPGHPEVEKAIDDIFAAVLPSGKFLGTVAGNAAQAAVLIAKGVCVILNSTQGLIANAAKDFLAARPE